MDEEVLLKSSFFGGYKKRDVLDYIDSVLDENEQKVNFLYERIDDLTKENKQMRMKLKKTRRMAETGDLAAMDEPIPFPGTLKQLSEDTDLAFIRKEMEIPEGNYFIDENEKVHLLPDPKPEFQVKGNWKANEKANAIENHGETRDFNKNEKVLFHSTELDTSFFDYDDMEGLSGKEIVKEPFLMEEMKEMQEQINELKLELESEKKEKQELEIKLNYSNELLLTLYKNPSEK